MIEMYIDQVIRHISPEQKEEVEKKLRKRIYKLLDGKTDEASIQEILAYLGDPTTVSEEYEQTLYLIGPRIYKSYTKVLKLMMKVVLIVSAASSILATLISAVLTFNFRGAVLNLLRALPSIVTLLIYTLVFVTFFFIIVERYMKEDTKVIIDYISTFQFKNLYQEIRKRFNEREENSYFSRLATIVHLLIGVVLLTLVVFFGVLADYHLIFIEFIDLTLFGEYQTHLIILFGSYVAYNSAKLIYKKWDSFFAALNIALAVLAIYIATLIYKANGLANQAFLDSIEFWLFGRTYVLGDVWPDIVFFSYIACVAYAVFNAARGVYRVIAQNIKKQRREAAALAKRNSGKVKHYRLNRKG